MSLTLRRQPMMVVSAEAKDYYPLNILLLYDCAFCVYLHLLIHCPSPPYRRRNHHDRRVVDWWTGCSCWDSWLLNIVVILSTYLLLLLNAIPFSLNQKHCNLLPKSLTASPRRNATLLVASHSIAACANSHVRLIGLPSRSSFYVRWLIIDSYVDSRYVGTLFPVTQNDQKNDLYCSRLL